MSKIIINKQVILDRIAELDNIKLLYITKEELKEKEVLQSILQQSEEYNENEAVDFLKYYLKNMGTIMSGFDFEKFYKQYKNARNIKK